MSEIDPLKPQHVELAEHYVGSESPPPRPPRKTTPPKFNQNAPEYMGGMDRNETGSYVDPIRAISSITTDQLEEVIQMDMEMLSRYFRSLGLRELPTKILDNGLGGSVLHSITEKDIDKMDFRILGEAKAFEDLCQMTKSIKRKDIRNQEVLEGHLVFWGHMHQYFDGPCDCCNTATKTHRDAQDRCWDVCCCSPQHLHVLPESKVEIFKDHMTIKYPRWNDEMPERYRDYQHGWASPNVSPFQVVSDHIDFSQIQDVDVEERPKIGAYRYTTADCWNRTCCRQLKREPNEGEFYWVTPCQKCCGYEHLYKERPDGIVTITLKSADSKGSTRKFGIVDGASNIARTILNNIEESQLGKIVRM